MVLHHFTRATKLASIRRGGLRAVDPNDHFPMFGGQLLPCVWLTRQPLPERSCIAPLPDAWITVVIREPHWRLISFPALLKAAGLIKKIERLERAKNGLRVELRANLGREPTSAELRAWRHWWVYFGNIPRRAVREAKKL